MNGKILRGTVVGARRQRNHGGFLRKPGQTPAIREFTYSTQEVVHGFIVPREDST